jgi:hypothetical protein
MKIISFLLPAIVYSTIVHAVSLETIKNEVSGELNKVRVEGIEVVSTKDYIAILEDQYDKEIAKGFIPDNALIAAIHYADIQTLKNDKSPNNKLTAYEIIEARKPAGSKEDLDVIAKYFDALDPEYDSSSYRRLAGALSGILSFQEIAQLAKNLTNAGSPGNIHYNHLYRAMKDSFTEKSN